MEESWQKAGKGYHHHDTGRALERPTQGTEIVATNKFLSLASTIHEGVHFVDSPVENSK